MNNIKSVSDLEKHYAFSRISGPKFNLDTTAYPDKLKIFIPYIEYFINDSQPDREYFFSKVPYNAISDVRELIKSRELDLNEWFDGQSNRLSHNFIALALLTILVDEYSIARNNKLDLDRGNVTKNFDDMLNTNFHSE
jgi:hypothetical protein